jgi:hypothetical protein
VFSLRRVAPLVGLLLQVGCVPLYFAPAPLAPQVERRGELEVSGAVGFTGVHAQAAYGVADRLGVAGQFQWGGASGSDGRSRLGYLELAAFHTTRLAEVIRIDVAAGAGGGFAHGNDLYESKSTSTWVHSGDARYVRPFAQVGLSFATRAFDLGVIPRFSYLRFDYSEVNGAASDRVDAETLFEPVVFLRFGWAPVKLGVYAGLTVPTGDANRMPPFFPFSLAATLSFYWDHAPLPAEPEPEPEPETAPEPAPRPESDAPR